MEIKDIFSTYMENSKNEYEEFMKKADAWAEKMLKEFDFLKLNESIKSNYPIDVRYDRKIVSQRKHQWVEIHNKGGYRVQIFLVFQMKHESSDLNNWIENIYYCNKDEDRVWSDNPNIHKTTKAEFVKKLIDLFQIKF